MEIDVNMMHVLQRIASAACKGRPYRLEIWITGAGHIMFDVYWHDEEFRIFEFRGGCQIGWDPASMYWPQRMP